MDISLEAETLNIGRSEWLTYTYTTKYSTVSPYFQKSTYLPL